MDKKKSSICLVMIVRNEASVIRRCLDSVAKYIDHWVIVDTGSDDGTQDIIVTHMAELGIPGNLYEKPWKDFGTNRTESLNLAAGKCDYRLVIDADDVLEVEDPTVFENLQYDAYRIPIQLDTITYQRTQLVRSSQTWKYHGVLHEYISYEGDEKYTEGELRGVKMVAGVSSDKRDAIKGKDKYHNDALIFEKEIITNTSLSDGLKSRYYFYGAQSYRDAGMPERAIELYKKRIELGGWDEEVYISLYNIARLKAELQKPVDEVINDLMKAWEFRPVRLEAAYELIKILLHQKRFFLAFSIGHVCLRMGGCTDVLFVEQDIWKWKFLDDYSVAAYNTGNFEEASKCTDILTNSPEWPNIPDEHRERIEKNKKAYDEALASFNKEKEVLEKDQPIQPPVVTEDI